MCPALRSSRRTTDAVATTRAGVTDPIVLRSATLPARARRVQGNPAAAHIVVFDGASVPAAEHWRRWGEELAAAGVTTMRTGALSPRQAEQAERAGLVCIQELALLDLSAPFDLTRRSRRTRRLRRGELPVLARIDDAAFGARWSLDGAMLGDVCNATPVHRARVVDHAPHGAAGFLISGRAARAGYIQRLAVHPDAQRAGIGSALLTDSLRWLARARVSRVFVNTHVDNHAALELYRRHSFALRPDRLRVFEGPCVR
jgi:ribosomal protein S18 acetylase RimI-like enzyme